MSPHKNAIINAILKAAERLNATVDLEPEWETVGKITYASGVTRFFRKSIFDLNTLAASEIAKDKGYARFFLEKNGYPIAKGKTFFRADWCKKMKAPDRGVSDAWKYAKNELGLPVYVKPNSKSRGEGVARVETEEEFLDAAAIATKDDKVFLVEQELLGRDYRVVVLDGEIISAYERRPLMLCGDGTATIRMLLLKKAEEFVQRGRATDIDPDDHRIAATLRRKGLDYDSVISVGEQIRLLDNANLSTGGEAVDVTNAVSDGFRRVAWDVSSEMGLRLVGLDLMVEGDLSTEPRSGGYWIIEINSAPGLDHYAMMGEAQLKIVEELYFRVIEAMEGQARPTKMVASSSL